MDKNIKMISGLPVPTCDSLLFPLKKVAASYPHVPTF